LAIAAVVGAVVAATATGSAATARDGQSVFREQLTSYEETPLALSTTGTGQIILKIDGRRDRISYRLSYSRTAGVVTQAHIHFGSPSQTGGVSAFLCSNLGNGPEGTPACPAAGSVTGTIRPDDVVGPAGQGIAAGEFDELVDAIRAGATYVNVHSDLFPVGEIRGHLETGHRH
jgi:hypothetical protein